MKGSTEIRSTPAVSLQLDALPENVMLVRQAVEGAVRGLGADGQLIEDIKLAVSEACSNVVKYAYGDGSGQMHVAIAAGESSIHVTVRDFGTWRPATEPTAEEPSGMGISLIDSVARGLDIQRGENGTEVSMVFGLDANRDE
jgi:serine/threonine-protein kinase RsbW